MIKKAFFFVLFFFTLCSISHAKKVEHGTRFRALVIGTQGVNTPDVWGTVLTGTHSARSEAKSITFEDETVFYKLSQHFPTFLLTLKQKGFVTAAGGVADFITSINKHNKINAYLSNGIVDFECGINQTEKISSVSPDAKHSCNLDFRQSFDKDDPNHNARLTAWMIDMINQDKADLIVGVYDNSTKNLSNHSTPKNKYEIKKFIAQINRNLHRRMIASNEAWLVIILSNKNPYAKNTAQNKFKLRLVGKQIYLSDMNKVRMENLDDTDVAPSILHWFDIDNLQPEGKVRSQYEWT